MRNFIGQIHDTRDLTPQIAGLEQRLKIMLTLDSIEIISTGNGFYSVTTDDNNIIDFKLDQYHDNKISLGKYRAFNDEGHRDTHGATLIFSLTISKEE